jgi:tyrosyl-tRNA synthetase
MLSRNSVKTRMEARDGMTFTEFSYQIFQGYDFGRLFEDDGCVLQVGGSDQWGNIASGIEYVRKVKGEETRGCEGGNAGGLGMTLFKLKKTGFEGCGE